MRKKIEDLFQRIAVIQQYAQFEHKLGIYSLWQPEVRIISSARAVASQYSSESWSSMGIVGVWIGAELVIADPVSFGGPVFINFFLV